ncbi:peptidoglycan D,D-transpeptidase FtsI family protein [Bacillus massilinigeriensis]|uniref:peptidoglycan D,D-transpeptidase FtsI family protein n=1 Tax=Bacillus massilionigeriensis TaxID=1805475 RepID=UPI00096ADEF4|nr:penicillin-binding protein 2 [Bacillus massilionigeriensis]
MWRKRAIVIGGIFIFMIFLLIGRLVEVQLVSTESFSKHQVNLLESSVKQRSQEVIIDSGRGEFLDRMGEPLTHKSIPVLILFPFLKNMEWDVEKVSKIIGISKFSLQLSIEKAKEPFAFGDPHPIPLTEDQMKEINELKIPGVFAVERKYDELDSIAEQLIGITGENTNVLNKRYPDKDLSPQTLVGLSGLEKSFDEFLLPEGKSKLVYHVDARGGPLFGINVKYVEPANPFYPVNVKTTIDKKLQMRLEKLVDGQGIKKGGLVLLDIKTNSVLAMVSRPKINRDAPFDERTSGIKNMMLTQQIMGSVFKTVVAAASIDYQLDDPKRTFDCSKKINGDPDPVYDHGMLNFSESFARSCNNTFGTLAKELKDMDPNLLTKYAEKLSLTGTVGWNDSIFHINSFKQLPDEEKGRVFLSEEAMKDDNFVALSGIGQHEVRATPLAIANMMSTIAKGGKKESVRVASEIQYKNGTSLMEFDKEKLEGETLSPYTAMKLQKLLRGVVTNDHGTGRWFQELPYEVAGKSGTAETDQYVKGKQLHNKWFAGYFPYKNPQYALVTVNLGVYEDEGAVNPLFASVVKAIYDYNDNN